jgi:hypothetical protein
MHKSFGLLLHRTREGNRRPCWSGLLQLVCCCSEFAAAACVLQQLAGRLVCCHCECCSGGTHRPLGRGATLR